MKRVIQFFILIILATPTVYAAYARGGVHTYRQADGSTFQATLHGDSTFHWMESNGKVILYNSQDKNYYNAEVTSDGKFVMGKQKVGTRARRTRALHVNKNIAIQTQESKQREALRNLQREARKGSHPL